MQSSSSSAQSNRRIGALVAVCVLLVQSGSDNKRRVFCDAFTPRHDNPIARNTRRHRVLQRSDHSETEPVVTTPRTVITADRRRQVRDGSAQSDSDAYAASGPPSASKVGNDRVPAQKGPNKRRQRVKNSATDKTNTQMMKKKKKRNDDHKVKQASAAPTMHTRGPWLASFHTSRHTQQRIQQAGRQNGHWSSCRRATYVLKTLLERTAVEHANAANLVCALCLTAKLRGSGTTGTTGTSTDDDATTELREYLWKAVAVLRQLNGKHQLSARQLCNAVWALAKHADRDPAFSPAPPTAAAAVVTTTLSAESHFGTAEEWSLDDDTTTTARQRMVDAVIDEIAVELADRLRDDPRVAKEGELGMACWAYGVLRARQRPAGWKWIPKLGRAVGVQNQQQRQQQQTGSNTQALRFETLQGPSLSGGVDGGAVDSDPPGPTDQLFDQIAQSLCRPVTSDTTTVDAPLRLRGCRWSELSHIAWAHASHGWSSCSQASEDLLLAVASEAARRLRSPSKHHHEAPLSRDMAQMVWSFGVLQTDNFHLTSGLLELLDGVAAFTQFPSPHVSRPFATWSCPDIVQIPLALAHARIDNQEMLRELYSEATDRIQSSSRKHGRRTLHAWEISILLWAQARLHLVSEQGTIFEDFSEDAIDFLLATAKNEGGWNAIGIGAQEQANLIWSLTVLEKFRSDKSIRLLQELFLASQEKCKETGMIQLEHAHQLWQALFLLEVEAPRAVEGIETWFRDTLEAKWLQEKARPKDSSARHKSLSKVLSDMGVAHFNEHDEDIDVAIVLKRAASWTHETDRVSLDGGMRVAVEFDGPNHFTRILDTESREAPRPLGHSILKYRLLKRQGWTVVRVPYYEFDRIPFWASMERQRYVQRLLKTHSDLRFSSVDVSEYSPPVTNRQSRFQ